MSSNSSSSYTYTSTTSSSTSTSESGTHSHSQTTRASYDDRTGGHAERITQETGKPTLVESTEVPAARGQVGPGSSASQGRITDVDEQTQAERDRLYEERMEEEYAKREGGA